MSRVNDSLKELQRRNAELSERLKQMPVIEQVHKNILFFEVFYHKIDEKLASY